MQTLSTISELDNLRPSIGDVVLLIETVNDVIDSAAEVVNMVSFVMTCVLV